HAEFARKIIKRRAFMIKIGPGALIILEICVSDTRSGRNEIRPLLEALRNLIVEYDERFFLRLMRNLQFRTIKFIGETLAAMIDHDRASLQQGWLRCQRCRHETCDERSAHPHRQIHQSEWHRIGDPSIWRKPAQERIDRWRAKPHAWSPHHFGIADPATNLLRED